MSESLIQIQRKLADVTAKMEKVEEELAEAQATLAKLREQEPAGYVFGDWRGATTISAVKGSHFNTPLYAEPIPVPAPAVPATCNDSLQVDIREMLQWLIDQRGKHGHNHKQSGIWDDDNGAMAGKPCEACAMYDKARALLQSTPQAPTVPDGRVSQDESTLTMAASALALFRAGESAEYMAKAIEALLQSATQSGSDPVAHHPV